VCEAIDVFFFYIYILLTVHLGIILVYNQLDTLFSVYLFPFSTCFKQPGAHHQENRSVSIHHLVYVTLCRWLPGMLVLTGIPGSHLHRWCIDTIRFFWWWALGCLKHGEKGNKYFEKSVSSWLLTRTIDVCYTSQSVVLNVACVTFVVLFHWSCSSHRSLYNAIQFF